MWEIKRPKSQEKKKTHSPVWKSRGWGLTGLRMTAGHGVNLLRSRGSHFCFTLRAYVCSSVCESVPMSAGATEANGIRHPELKLQKVESRPECVLRTELGSSASGAHALPSPCGVPDSERRKMEEMSGVSVHESNGSQPQSGSAWFYYLQSEHWEKTENSTYKAMNCEIKSNILPK